MTISLATPKLAGSPLTAPTPAQWWETHLDPWFRRHQDGPVDESARSWMSTAALLADDAAHLRAVHARLMVQDGAPAQAAAKWVTGWFAGTLARTVGFVFATAHAALVFPPGGARFGLHKEGWADLVDVSDARVAAAAGHPWADLDGVTVVEDDVALASLAVTSLEATIQPLVEAARGLGRVGRAALWAELADEFGLSLLYQVQVDADPATVERVRAALRAPGAPWRKRPTLQVAEHDGRARFVGRKGGCCLAYSCEGRHDSDDEVDPEHTAYLEHFGEEPPEKSFCGTCSLRDVADCAARQLFWLDRQRVAGPV